jgi:hypothetical protein
MPKTATPKKSVSSKTHFTGRYSSQVGYCLQIPAKTAAPYFGSIEFDLYPPVLQQLIIDAPQYIDITAGGGNVLITRGMANQPVVGNDRCIYAAMSLQVLLQNALQLEIDRETWFEALCERLHPDNVTPVNGYMTACSRKNVFPFLNPGTARYLDGLCATNDPVFQVAVGQTLMRLTSFRFVAPARITQTGVPTEAFLEMDCFAGAAKGLLRSRITAEYLARFPAYQQHQVFIGDALDALHTAHIIPGAVVYADPAWPWGTDRPMTAHNPYKFQSEVITSCMVQQQQVEIPFWTVNNPERTLQDITAWIATALEHGVEHFILATQSTNDPNPELVFEHLLQKFPHVSVLQEDVYSSVSNQQYIHYFGVVSATHVPDVIQKALQQQQTRLGVVC